ncbi:hypothetical protein [Fischerella sp. PCC 9605]|nr:hypothetical protein [Fischerella sp. PCC 9605]
MSEKSPQRPENLSAIAIFLSNQIFSSPDFFDLDACKSEPFRE